jgi:glycosyltransferase involved in cell wall biosynthesis
MSKDIKLLTIIETLGKGGAERVLVNILPELQKLGLECEVAILFNRDDLAKELEEYKIKVHRLNLSYKWNIFEGIYKLNRLIKENRYDIVHAHLFFAYFYTGLSKLFFLRVKRVVTFHSLTFDVYSANSLWKKIRKFIECIILRLSFNRYTAVSNAVKKHFQQHCSIKKIDVIFNSFPIEKLTNVLEIGNKNSSVRIKKDKFLILTAGRLVKEKGHKYLIEAIKILNKKYNNLQFLFIGDGPLKDEFKQIIPNNVIIKSAIPHKDLMKLYNEVDIIVIPSVFEAFGLVVGEAMIMQKGIVATNVDGIVEMIDHEKEGLLVPPKNPQALANAIEKLYLDINLREKLSKNAREKIKQFDTKIIAQEWKNYYEDMLNE